MREEESNWFARWEEELPTPEELMPLSQSLITPDLALAFDISASPTSPSSPTASPSQPHHRTSSPPPHLLSPLHFPQDNPSHAPSSHPLPPPLQADFDSSDLGGGSGGGGAGGGAGPGEEPARTLKRPRLVWTPQLHKRFVDAVAHLGIKNAVPKTIMQLMNVEGLTRENVASHLQKYRLYLKRMQGLSSGAAGAGAPVSSADPATDHLFASAPVPHHFLSRGPASAAVVHGGGGVSGGGPEQFLPFVPVSALQHHQQMAAAAAAAAAHQQQQYYHQRHMGHMGSPPGGGFDHGYLARPQQPGIQMMMAPGGPAIGPSPTANSYADDSEPGAGVGAGRKMLTLFPTGDD